MNDRELKINTIKSLAWKLFERGGNAVVQLVIQIIMARLLSPNEFGALAILLVFVNLGNVIVQSGLNTSLIQSEAVEEADFSTVFWMSFAVSIILYALIFVSAPRIAKFYALPSIVWPLRAISAILVINSLNSVQVAKVTRELKMKKIFFATVVSVILSAIFGIFAAVYGCGLWSLVIQQVSYQAINCIVLSVQVDWHPRPLFDWSKAKKHFKFGWRLLASGLLDQGYQSLSDLVIGKQFSSVELGLVSQGKKYPQALGSMLDGSIQPVMLSAVAHVQDNKTKVKALVRRALKTSTFLIFPAMTLFACCSPTIVPMLLGPQWLPSVPFLQIYCFVYALLPIHTTNLQALNGTGRSDVFLKLEIIKKAYGLAALLVCGFVFKDIKLLVLSYLLTGVISTFVNSYPNKRLIDYSYTEQIRDIAPVFLMAGLAACPTILISKLALAPIVILLLQCAVFITVYVVGVAIIGLEAFTYLTNLLKRMGSKK